MAIFRSYYSPPFIVLKALNEVLKDFKKHRESKYGEEYFFEDKSKISENYYYWDDLREIWVRDVERTHIEVKKPNPEDLRFIPKPGFEGYDIEDLDEDQYAVKYGPGELAARAASLEPRWLYSKLPWTPDYKDIEECKKSPVKPISGITHNYYIYNMPTNLYFWVNHAYEILRPLHFHLRLNQNAVKLADDLYKELEKIDPHIKQAETKGSTQKL